MSHLNLKKKMQWYNMYMHSSFKKIFALYPNDEKILTSTTM